MRLTRRTEAALDPVLDRMLAEKDEHARDRILVQAALDLSGADAAELWHRGERGWHPLLGLGEAERVPPPARVRACLEQRIGEDVLPSGEMLVRSPPSPSALALGGVLDRRASDALEALLLIRDALGPWSQHDSEVPPLPGASRSAEPGSGPD